MSMFSRKEPPQKQQVSAPADEPTKAPPTSPTKNSVAPAQPASVPAVAGDDPFFAHAGMGMENVTARDLIIPRLTIIQGLSPQLQKSRPEFIAGATVGDICDVGTGELFDSPLLFLPVYYITQYLEWAPRASGKGLVAIHDDPTILDQCEENEKRQPILPNGNYVAQTAQFFGINLIAGRRSFLPMASTQLKKARKWLTIAQSEKVKRPDGTEYTPPLFYRAYNLSTAEESNNEGSWVGWKIERGPKMTELDNWQALYKEALDFHTSLKKGELKGDLDREEPQTEVGSEAAM